MTIRSSEFLCAAVKPSQYPADDSAEIAFAGRSNVGKSSLINQLLNRRKLAKVSSTPGKTRTINFYNINNGEFRLVDLPGYGYAKVSKAESADWGRMMEDYLSGRKGLRKVIQLVDSRHAPTAQDKQMYDYLRYYGLDGIVVATKSDKLSSNELRKNLSVIRKELEMSRDDVLIASSALKNTGSEEILEVMQEIISWQEY